MSKSLSVVSSSSPLSPPLLSYLSLTISKIYNVGFFVIEKNYTCVTSQNPLYEKLSRIMKECS